VIVVVARNGDVAARELVARWEAHDACLLTPAALSTAGWRFRPGEPHGSVAVLNGRRTSVREIRGVVTRLVCVTEADLPHIEQADRAYVAAEMTAFLLSWLSSLNCRVINRATPSGLAGPNWRTEQWTHLAARIGVPVDRVSRSAIRGSAPAFQSSPIKLSVTVVGDACFGAPDAIRASWARRVAKVARVDLLEVELSGGEGEPIFLGARVCPDEITSEVADAILDFLVGSSSRSVSLGASA